MIVSIHQPDFIPYLGYFDKIKRADIFIFLDEAQLDKNRPRNRNKIKTPQGWSYITIPLEHHYYLKPIKDAHLPQDNTWREKHLKTFQMFYKKSPYFDLLYPRLEKIYHGKTASFSEFNIQLIKEILNILDIKTELKKESELAPDSGLAATERLIHLLRLTNASQYISGPSGKKYLDTSLFPQNNIKLEIQHYEFKPYPQLFGEFIPMLSVIDAVFNLGPKAKDII